MAKVKRIIEKVEPVRTLGLEDQFWPVVVSLCILGGFINGAALALLDGFWLWACIFLAPITVISLIMFLRVIDHRIMRRSIVLASILSLIIHIAILILCNFFSIFAGVEAEVAEVPLEKPKRVAKRHVEFNTTPWQKPEKQVEPEPVKEEVKKQQPKQSTAKQKPQPVPVEKPEAKITPQQQKRKVPSQTTPKKSQTMAKMSRRQTTAQAQAGTAAESPTKTSSAKSSMKATEATLTQKTSKSKPTPTKTPSKNPSNVPAPQNPTKQPTSQLAKRADRTKPNPNTSAAKSQSRTKSTASVSPGATAKVRVEVPTNSSTKSTQPSQKSLSQTLTKSKSTSSAKRTNPTTPTTPSTNPSASLQANSTARRRSDPTKNTSSASSAKSLTRSNTTPRATAAINPVASANTPTSSAANSANRLAANTAKDTIISKQQTRATTSRNVAQPTPQNAKPTPASRNRAVAARRPNRPDEPKIALSTRSIRRSSKSELPNTSAQPTTSKSSEVATANKSTKSALNPTNTRLTQRTERTASATTRSNPSPKVTSSPTAQLARSQTRRTTESVPNPTPSATSSKSIRRNMQIAAAATSPTNAENPVARSDNASRSQNQPSPTKLALNKGTRGRAGKGMSSNLNSAQPSSDRPAIDASNSARRARAVSATTDAALSPSTAAQIPKAVAGKQSPQSNTTVSQANDAQRLASNEQSRLTASASASKISTGSKSAQRSQLSADAGTASIDVGPMKIVNENSSGRAAGGGSPELDSQSEAKSLERTTGLAKATPTITTDLSAEIAQTTVKEDGGSNSRAENRPDANTIAQTDIGKASPTSSGPTSADAVGPTSDESSSPTVSENFTARSSAAESMRNSKASDGGGSPEDDEELKRLLRTRMAGGPSASANATIEVETDLAMAGNPGENENSQDVGIDEVVLANTRTQNASSASTSESGGIPNAEINKEIASANSGGRRSAERNPSEESGSVAAKGGLGKRSLQSVPMNVQVEGIAAADMGDSQPASSGGGAIGELDAGDSGIAKAKSASGPGESNFGIEGDLANEAAKQVGGLASGRRSSAAESDMTGTGQPAGQKIERRPMGEIAGGSAAPSIEIDMSEFGQGATGAVDQNQGSGNVDGIAKVGIEKKDSAGQAVELAAADGPGGLGERMAPKAGLNSRKARETDAPIQAFSETRFNRRESGGVPSLNTTAVFAAKAFQNRGAPGDGGPQTEPAIELGLRYLTNVQRENGRWILQVDDKEATDSSMNSDTAATGLALLAYQGAGYNHKEYKYAKVIDRGLKWLVAAQDKKTGGLFVEADKDSNGAARLYSHAIATIALCEAYGMTQDEALREPTQMALKYIADSQDPVKGGWRYAPGRDADTSVTGWMMMALKSGKLAGLNVEKKTFTLINEWLESAQSDERPYKFRYNPYAKDEGNIIRSHGRKPTPCMTAVGLLMKLYSGWDRDNENMLKGADYILGELPSDTNERLRDTYYWYYATQVLRHVGGERWEMWHSVLHPLLVKSQVQEGKLAGSWDPLRPIPDRWGAFGGRVYVTAMNLLSLEVDYRLLPLYDETAK